MKWFQHSSDSYTNLKMQELIHDCGMEGYGFFWLCCELIAQQGTDYQITNDKNWKKILSLMSTLDVKVIEKYLALMASINLIDKKALEKNVLFIPKMGEYSDDYTKRHRRVSEQSTDTVPTKSEKVPLDKNRVDKTTLNKSIDTPQKQAEEFFNKALNSKLYNDVLDSLSKSLVDRNVVEKELNAFILYWTEPNKSGTKQRWEIQKTFDVKRRLYRWFKNKQEWSGSKKTKEIIGL